MTSLEKAIEKIFATRRITRRDQHMLMSLFSQKDINASDSDLINQVYEALSQGRLRVVD